MNESLHLTAIARVVEELLASESSNQRDRILIDAVFELEAAQAASVWRPVEDATLGSGTMGSWRAVLERGPSDALPRTSLVQAVLDQEHDRNLPGRGVVLRLGDEALVLGEVENPDGRVDLLEALLHLGTVLDQGSDELADGLQGPLPGPEDREDEPL